MVDRFLAAARKRVLLDEIPWRLLFDVVANDLDLLWISTAKSQFVGTAYEAQAHGIKALEFGGDGIDSDLIC